MVPGAPTRLETRTDFLHFIRFQPGCQAFVWGKIGCHPHSPLHKGTAVHLPDESRELSRSFSVTGLFRRSSSQLTTCGKPVPSLRLVKMNGRLSRCNRASRSITSNDAPT